MTYKVTTGEEHALAGLACSDVNSWLVSPDGQRIAVEYPRDITTLTDPRWQGLTIYDTSVNSSVQIDLPANVEQVVWATNTRLAFTTTREGSSDQGDLYFTDTASNNFEYARAAILDPVYPQLLAASPSGDVLFATLDTETRGPAGMRVISIETSAVTDVPLPPQLVSDFGSGKPMSITGFWSLEHPGR